LGLGRLRVLRFFLSKRGGKAMALGIADRLESPDELVHEPSWGRFQANHGF
jgi:hypothetical protein